MDGSCSACVGGVRVCVTGHRPLVLSKPRASDQSNRRPIRCDPADAQSLAVGDVPSRVSHADGHCLAGANPIGGGRDERHAGSGCVRRPTRREVLIALAEPPQFAGFGVAACGPAFPPLIAVAHGESPVRVPRVCRVSGAAIHSAVHEFARPPVCLLCRQLMRRSLAIGPGRTTVTADSGALAGSDALRA